jgi:hypothetical protein
LDLSSHDGGPASVGEDQVDHPSGRFGYWYLETHQPSWIDPGEERFGHGRLESIVDARSDTLEIPEAQICPERDADRRERRQARIRRSGLDPGHVRLVYPGDVRQRGHTEADVGSHPPNVVSQPQAQPLDPPSRFPLDMGSGDTHAHRRPRTD